MVKLATFNRSAFQLQDEESLNLVSKKQAIKAMNVLRRGLESPVLIGKAQPADNQFAEDLPMIDSPTGPTNGTYRRGLKMHAHVPTETKGSEPIQSDDDFPTLQRRFRHWTLNKK